MVDEVFERVVDRFHVDPYTLRDDYIQVLIGQVSLEEFVKSHVPGCTDKTCHQTGYLLRAQYERQRMFTSCGWFFDDFNRIEPRNNVNYAAQAFWLTKQVEPELSQDEILVDLKKVKSNRSSLSADQVFISHLRLAENYWTSGSSNT